MTFQHYVRELVAIKGTKSQLKSGQNMDQVLFEAPPQLNKVLSRLNLSNRNLTNYKITNTIRCLQNIELNTTLNTWLCHIPTKIEVNYDN